MVDRNPERARKEILEEELFEPRWPVGTARANQPPNETRLLVNELKGEEKNNTPLAERDENGKPIRHIVIAAGFIVVEGRRVYSVRHEAITRMSDMSPEKRDFSSWEYTGDFLTPRQAAVFDKKLQGLSNGQIAQHLRISENGVASIMSRIGKKIEAETGKRPEDFIESVMLMAQLGELVYNPKNNKY